MPDTEVEVTAESLLANCAAEDAGAPAKTAEAAPAAPAKAKAPTPKEAADTEEPIAATEPDTSKIDKTESTTTEGEKPKSKWAKNEERKTQTWEQINADKLAIKAERDELQRQRDEFQQSKISTQELRDEHNASAKEYREAAAQFKAKGDIAMAEAAEKLAGNLEVKEQGMRQQQAMQEGAAKWTKNLADLTVKHPTLADNDSPLSKAALKVLEVFPDLKRNPDGIKYAVRAAEIELQAATFDGTKAELTKLKADYAALQKKLTISGGSPTDPIPAKKSFSDLSQKDARRSLEQAAEQHDRDNY